MRRVKKKIFSSITFDFLYCELTVLTVRQEKASLAQQLQNEHNKRAKLDEEVANLRAIIESRESSLAQEKNLVTQLQSEVTRLKVMCKMFRRQKCITFLSPSLDTDSP